MNMKGYLGTTYHLYLSSASMMFNTLKRGWLNSVAFIWYLEYQGLHGLSHMLFNQLQSLEVLESSLFFQWKEWAKFGTSTHSDIRRGENNSKNLRNNGDILVNIFWSDMESIFFFF